MTLRAGTVRVRPPPGGWPSEWQVVEGGDQQSRIPVYYVVHRAPDIFVGAKNAWITEAAAQAMADALNDLQARGVACIHGRRARTRETA